MSDGIKVDPDKAHLSNGDPLRYGAVIENCTFTESREMTPYAARAYDLLLEATKEEIARHTAPLRDEIEQLQMRIKSMAYISPLGVKMPQILEVVAADGQHWNECSNCRDELTGHNHDGGSALECGLCGARWWEGELDEDSETTKDKTCTTYNRFDKRICGLPVEPGFDHCHCHFVDANRKPLSDKGSRK